MFHNSSHKMFNSSSHIIFHSSSHKIFHSSSHKIFHSSSHKMFNSSSHKILKARLIKTLALPWSTSCGCTPRSSVWVTCIVGITWSWSQATGSWQQSRSPAPCCVLEPDTDNMWKHGWCALCNTITDLYGLSLI